MSLGCHDPELAGLVAHYSSQAALTSLVQRGGLGSLWSSPEHLLNDRSELSLGLEDLPQEVILRSTVYQGGARLLELRGLDPGLLVVSQVPCDPR